MTLILDQVLSQSLKLDGRTTEARVMNSSSTEYQEITTLKVLAVYIPGVLVTLLDHCCSSSEGNNGGKIENKGTLMLCIGNNDK